MKKKKKKEKREEDRCFRWIGWVANGGGKDDSFSSAAQRICRCFYGHRHVLQRRPHSPQSLLFSCSVRFGTWKAFVSYGFFPSSSVPFVFYSS